MSPTTLPDTERVFLAHSCAAPVVECNTKRVELIACVLTARFNTVAILGTRSMEKQWIACLNKAYGRCISGLRGIYHGTVEEGARMVEMRKKGETS